MSTASVQQSHENAGLLVEALRLLENGNSLARQYLDRLEPIGFEDPFGMNHLASALDVPQWDVPFGL